MTEFSSCRGLDLSASRTTPLHLRDKDLLSSRLASTSNHVIYAHLDFDCNGLVIAVKDFNPLVPKADECQASPSSMANAGENNTRKKLSFVQSPVLKVFCGGR